MSLDLTKPVQTRDGSEVQQLTVFACKGSHPIVGVVDGNKISWTREGFVVNEKERRPCDLVNVPERVQHTGYFRVWRNREGGWEFSSMMPHAPDLSLEAGPYLGYIRVDIDTDIITSTEGKNDDYETT